MNEGMTLKDLKVFETDRRWCWMRGVGKWVGKDVMVCEECMCDLLSDDEVGKVDICGCDGFWRRNEMRNYIGM
ncbi:hypothetical protein, partial [Siminovitchia fortis]|uniref:hypothetical protein n=1 Tax=Siminovitchia fortis TaxID=254758 RepID=UPI001C931A0C